MKIYIGSDHRGFNLKNKIIDLYKNNQEYEIIDCGNSELDPNDDYVDYAYLVAKNVSNDKKGLGILICGTGFGMCISANKIKGIRAIQSHNMEEIITAKSHNQINILCLGAEFVEASNLLELIQAFFETEISLEVRHQRRIDKIVKLENNL